MNFKEKLLAYLKINEEDFAFLTRPLDEIVLPNPQNFIDMEKATSVIKSVMEQKGKIVIYGDYDADGIMSTSILYNTFLKLDYPVGYYVPSRYIDGYGLNIPRVEEMAEKGYQLIITVDNGIAQHDAIARAYELGMQVIVTDHHEPGQILPKCEAILHPIVSNYGSTYCCGAYVAFMLSWALLGYGDDYLLSLAAIATISDMMELKDYNRDIVRLGLFNMQKNKYPPIELLYDKTRESLNERTLGLSIAPKINAIGRVIKDTRINQLVRYFSSKDDLVLRRLSDFIIQANTARKEMTKNHTNKIDVNEGEDAIIRIEDVEEGIIGLMANKLMNEHHKATIIFTEDSTNQDILKGSARSKEGLNIKAALDSLQELLIVYGGHELAGGLSIEKKHFSAFKTAFNAYAHNHPLKEEEPDFIDISINDITDTNVDLLEALAPFGQGFTLPLFKISNIKVSALKYTASREHILTPLGVHQKLIGFNYSPDCFLEKDFVHVIGTMERNFYRQMVTIDFKINRIQDVMEQTIAPQIKVLNA